MIFKIFQDIFYFWTQMMVFFVYILIDEEYINDKSIYDELRSHVLYNLPLIRNSAFIKTK